MANLSAANPIEDTAAALAALQIAGHALGVVCDKLNSLSHAIPDSDRICALADRASSACGEVNDLTHKVRYAQKGIRALKEDAH